MEEENILQLIINGENLLIIIDSDFKQWSLTRVPRMHEHFRCHCLDFLKNRVADLECQVTEKDAIISFVLK